MHTSRSSHMERRSIGLCVWGGMGASQGEAPQREDGGRGRWDAPLCVWVRLSTTQMRRRRHMKASRRDRRGAGSVVQGPGRRGGGGQARGSLSDLCVFVGWFGVLEQAMS